MTALDQLRRELDTWEERDLQARLWWRDDDLGDPTAKLDPLLQCAGHLEIEPVLAVVPRWASDALPRRLADQKVCIAMHGWAHIDHQAGRGKKAEFGDARPIADLVKDARAGQERLADLFGSEPIDCFVPPWNRTVLDLAELLPSLGFQGISTFGTHRNTVQGCGVRWVNTHIDVIDWRGNRRFVGPDPMAEAITKELVSRRREVGPTCEPIGLLTHHLEMTKNDWTDFEAICAMLVTHPSTKMLGSRDIFARHAFDE